MEIIPFRSIGSINFGDSKHVARQRFHSVPTEFQKDVDEESTDAYDDYGLHLYYDCHQRVEFVEAFSPADPIFRNVKFIGRKLNEVVSDLSRLGFSSESSEMGCMMPEAGLAVIAPTGIVEGVSVFREGYFD